MWRDVRLDITSPTEFVDAFVEHLQRRAPFDAGACRAHRVGIKQPEFSRAGLDPRDRAGGARVFSRPGNEQVERFVLVAARQGEAENRRPVPVVERLDISAAQVHEDGEAPLPCELELVDLRVVERGAEAGQFGLLQQLGEERSASAGSKGVGCSMSPSRRETEKLAPGIDVRRVRDPFAMLQQSAPGTEASSLDAIAAGDLDDHLDALAAAVNARQELLHTVRSATKLMSLCEGDLVVINERISPRYLAGLWGEVVDVDDGA